MFRRARLRIAVPEHLTKPLLGGDGRVWREGLRRLASRERVIAAAPGEAVRADVWLTDITTPDPGPGPRVCVVHEASWVEPDFAAALLEAELQWVDAATQTAVAAATRVLVPSRAGAAQVAALTGAEAGCDVVPYGVDLRAHRPRRGGRAILDRAGAQGLPVVLFVGVAHPKKNIAALREAARALAAAGTPLALALVLSAAPRPDADDLLRAALAPLDGVVIVALDTPANAAAHNLGDRDLAAVMTAAVCMCLPSLGEGFGLPVAEAMACGTPAVVSDRGALPEVIGDAGLVTGVDAESVAAALGQVLGDGALRARLSGAARARARELTWARMADGWAQSLRRAVMMPA